MSSPARKPLSPTALAREAEAAAPGRRERVIADIQAALLDTRLTLVDDRTTGFDPYNSGGGRARRDVWTARRRR